MKKLMIVFFLATASARVFSQGPVYIPVQNVSQQNPMWCWAAVSEQLVMYKKNISPKQCELATTGNRSAAANCCESSSICNAPGTLQQIQAVLNQFGIEYSAALPITDPNVLYNVLSRQHPVVVLLRSGRIPGHCIVITGMSGPSQATVPNGEFIDPMAPSNSGQGNVYVNDPTGTYSQSMSFSTLVSLWSDGFILK
jgi:hypothetical protein